MAEAPRTPLAPRLPFLLFLALLVALPLGPGAHAADDEPATAPPPAAGDGDEGDEAGPTPEEVAAEEARKKEEERLAALAAKEEEEERLAAQREKEERERLAAGIAPIEIDPACTPYAGGMILLPGGKVPIGTKPADLARLLEGRPKEQADLFQHERPQFTMSMRPFLMGRTELTNAQYLLFMKSTEKTYDTAVGARNTLDQIAEEVWNIEGPELRHPRYKAPFQLYVGNKDVIWQAFQGVKKGGVVLLDLLIKRLPGGEVDEKATYEAMRREPLPRGTQLRYMGVRPPEHWNGIEPPADEMDQPIRGISYNDLEAYAEWAGMHVQTEFEYEYAARGPQANPWPWGTERPTDESRLNWGSKIVDNRYEARPVNVEEIPAGRSWCGALHLSGNVSEWTSSWFENYPGNKEPNRFLGTSPSTGVKIIRGGGAKDTELLVLRPAHRNWEGSAADGPPYPYNRYAWVGGRMAAYLEPGRDQLGPITRRAVRRNKVREHWLDPAQYRGAVTRDWAAADAVVENHVHVLGPAASIVFIPVKTLLFEDTFKDHKEAWERPNRVNKISLLKKASESDFPLFVLGVLHTDVALVDLEAPIPEHLLDEEQKKQLEKDRRRGKALRPITRPDGEAPPGTYVLGYWHGEVCVLDTAMDVIGFVAKLKDQPWQVDVLKAKAEDVPEGVFVIDEDLDEGRITHTVALGGKKPDPKIWVRMDIGLRFKAGMLYQATRTKNPWQISEVAKAGTEEAEAPPTNGGGKAKPDKPEKPDEGDGAEPDDKPEPDADAPEDAPEDEPADE